MKKYTSQEIASRIGVVDTLVEEWTEMFNVPHRILDGRYVYPETSYHLLAHIKKLKDEQDGLNTIRRKIEGFMPENEPPGVPLPPGLMGRKNPVPPTVHLPLLDQKKKPESLPEVSDLSQQQAELKVIMEEAVIAGLNQHNDLADKYAAATYLIGKHEQRIQTLELQVQELQNYIRQLEKPSI